MLGVDFLHLRQHSRATTNIHSSIHSVLAMRSQALRPAAWHRIYDAAPRSLACQRRFININATPASSNPSSNTINIPDPSSSQPVPGMSRSSEAGSLSLTGIDAQFEILGSPFSLLSASVSASQPLYTRKGTLVGFNGKAESVRTSLGHQYCE